MKEELAAIEFFMGVLCIVLGILTICSGNLPLIIFFGIPCLMLSGLAFYFAHLIGK